MKTNVVITPSAAITCQNIEQHTGYIQTVIYTTWTLLYGCMQCQLLKDKTETNKKTKAIQT